MLISQAMIGLAFLPPSASAQMDSRPADAIIADPAGLSSFGIQRILVAARAAMAGKAFRAGGDLGSLELQMGADGRIQYVRSGGVTVMGAAMPHGVAQAGKGETLLVTHYTHQPARRCDGTPAGNDLVIEFTRSGNKWGVAARGSTENEALNPVFKLWELPVSHIEDAGFAEIQGCKARGLRYLHPSLPGIPDCWRNTRMVAFFDMESLLLVRWKIDSDAAGSYGYDFAYDAELDLRPPPDWKAPECIPVTGPR